jgi:hypothetical protein
MLVQLLIGYTLVASPQFLSMIIWGSNYAAFNSCSYDTPHLFAHGLTLGLIFIIVVTILKRIRTFRESLGIRTEVLFVGVTSILCYGGVWAGMFISPNAPEGWGVAFLHAIAFLFVGGYGWGKALHATYPDGCHIFDSGTGATTQKDVHGLYSFEALLASERGLAWLFDFTQMVRKVYDVCACECECLHVREGEDGMGWNGRGRERGRDK